jgi:sarcosine oxidase subunit beta
MSGNTVIGGCRLFRGYDIRSEYEIMQAIAERAIRFFPILKDINCIRSFGGIRPFSLDHLPIVSAVDDIPGFYIAAGHEGDGVALAPITGLLMAQIICEEELEFPEAKELSWDRFKDVDLATLKEHP